MNKIATYLQGHLQGEVLMGAKVRAKYAKDGSILEQAPEAVLFPQDIQDIRKIARFVWQLAEKGHVVPLTPRGHGNNTTGAAIGSGIVVDVSRHMNRILEVDSKQRLARVQAGVSAQVLAEALYLHGLCFPPISGAQSSDTIGGLLANGDSGKRAGKHGSIAAWIDQVEVVLANGDVAQFGTVSKKEINKKKGLTSFEGDIYRNIDALLTDEADFISEHLTESQSAIGYALADLKQKDGAINMVQLLVGSQGTLGTITEIILRLAPYNPLSEMLIIGCATSEEALEAAEQLAGFEPAEVTLFGNSEMVFVLQQQGVALETTFGDDTEIPKVLVFATFDDTNDRTRQKKVKRAAKALEQAGATVLRSDDFDTQQQWQRLYQRIVAALSYDEVAGRTALPFVETVAIPGNQLQAFMTGVAALSAKHHTPLHVWGDPLTGIFQARPYLDLRRITDRQKIFRLMDEYITLVLELDGDFAVQTAEGRLLAPFATKKYSKEVLELFTEVKKIFDPLAILNTGVKTLFDPKKLAPLVADDYSPHQ